MLASVLIPIICIFVAYLYWKHKKLADSLPPGPPPIPFIGNTWQMDAKDPRKTFLEWHKKYGPIYTVWIGHTPTIFITGHQLLQELFVKRADEFVDRPESFLFNVLMKGKNAISMVNGETWKEQRRFAMHTLRNFGVGRKLMEEKMCLEIEKLIVQIESGLSKQTSSTLNFKSMTEICVANIISSLMLGRSYDFNDETLFKFKNRVDFVLESLGNWSCNLLNSFPWFRFLPFYGRLGYDEFYRVNDLVLDNISSEVSRNKKNMGKNLEPNNFTEAYLMEIKRRRDTGADIGSFSEWQLVCVIYDMWTAGMFISTMVEWATLLMMHYPDVQKKVQKEIQDIIGLERGPTMNDKPQMPYTCAVIQELFRYTNIVTQNLSRMSYNDSDVNGYVIPKGVAIVPLMSVVHYDDAVFSNPDTFNPDRFLEQDKKSLMKSDTILMPFSLGKRICPGEGLSRMEIFLIFTSLLQKFSFTFIENEPKPDLIPIVSFFTTQPKPYKVNITRRM